MKLFQWVLCLSVLATLSSGCSARERHLAVSPPFGVEIVPTGPTYVTEGRVRRSEGGLVVAGTVRRPHEVHLAGHVDVEVLGPGGELIGRKRGDVPGLLSNRKGFMDLPFLVRLDFLPPAGSAVRLRYHAPPSGEEPG